MSPSCINSRDWSLTSYKKFSWSGLIMIVNYTVTNKIQVSVPRTGAPKKTLRFHTSVKYFSDAQNKILVSWSSLFLYNWKLFPFPLGSNSLRALYFIHSSVLCSEQNEENPIHISKRKKFFFLNVIFAPDSLGVFFFFLTVSWILGWDDGSDLYF